MRKTVLSCLSALSVSLPAGEVYCQRPSEMILDVEARQWEYRSQTADRLHQGYPAPGIWVSSERLSSEVRWRGSYGRQESSRRLLDGGYADADIH